MSSIGGTGDSPGAVAAEVSSDPHAAGRLDQVLAARGLARSRSHAVALIKDGLVTVDGAGVVKPATMIEARNDLRVAGADHYVSRGAHKLIAALDAFALDVSGRDALDLGASTGGFTQVLLERGARSVIALDVGHGQLDAALRADRRVAVVEGFNARELSSSSLAAALPPSAEDRESLAPSIVVADLSFISLSHVLAPIAELVSGAGAVGPEPAVAARSGGASVDIVVLIKPQFEVGRTGVREGIVTDPGLRADAVQGVLWAAWDAGLATRGVIGSSIVGTHGNREALAWLQPRSGGKAPEEASGNPTEWIATVNAWAGV